MSINTKICNFYRDVIGPKEIKIHFEERIEEISPLSRYNFNIGVGLAIIFLVQNIALSIFFLIASVLTLGLDQRMKTSLMKNVEEGIVYTGAISLGILGILFPQFTNQTILEIPPEGLTIRSNVTNLLNETGIR